MVCSQCKATVPEESAFCLRCGTRLVRLERPAPVNGRGVKPRVAAPATAPKVAAAGPASKQAYALSFKPLADERLRYRVARWVCEMAPVHGLAEVQADLSRGEFATFLALTAEEVETTRRRIEKLGAHPALWRLVPASTAEMLLPARPREDQQRTRWSPQKQVKAAGLFLAFLLACGLIFLFLWGPTAGKPALLPTTPPTIESRP